MTILSIEHEFARKIAYEEIIDKLARLKVKKANF